MARTKRPIKTDLTASSFVHKLRNDQRAGKATRKANRSRNHWKRSCRFREAKRRSKMYTPDVSASSKQERARITSQSAVAGSKRSLPASAAGQTYSPRPTSSSSSSQLATPNYRGGPSASASHSSTSSPSSTSLYPSLGPFQSPNIRTSQARRQTIASGGGVARRQASTPTAASGVGPSAKRRKRVVHETDRIRIESLSPWPAEVARRLRDATKGAAP